MTKGAITMTDIEELKQDNPILEVARMIGLNPKGFENNTHSCKCFAHDDKLPSLVFMPKVNRFECKVCGIKGDIFDLLKQVKGLEFKEAVTYLGGEIKESTTRTVQTPQEYLKSRGITLETAKKFGITIDRNKLIIPLSTGEKYRLFGSDRKWGQKAGTSACLFKTSNSVKKVILTEGEIDAISLWQHTGYPAWSNSCGADTFKEDFLKDFEHVEKVLIGYDNDEAGRKGAEKAASILGKDRCWQIEVPQNAGKDWSDYFRLYKKDDFDELLKIAKPFATPKLNFEELMTKLNEFWLNPDPDALRLVFSVLVAFRLDCDPIWVFLIAPPASLKTEFITGLSLIDDVYNLSKLTPQTLASGLKEKGKKNFSLLDKIQSKVLTFKDFTTILSGRWDALQEILGQLREVYDGKFVAEYGTGVKIDWKGKMGFLAGTTQKIDEHSTVSASLGERFIQYRMPGLDEIDLAMRSMNNASKSKKIREDVTLLFKGFFEGLGIPKTIEDISISQEYLLKLAHLAAFAVRGRSGTSRDYQTKELTYIPDPEAPARLAQQLAILIKCLAIINGRQEVTAQEFETVVKVAFDCFPRQRLNTLNALFKIEGKKTTAAISVLTGYSTNATKYFLEDMAAFGITTVDKTGNPHVWDISKKTKNYILKGFAELQKPKKEFKEIYQWWLTHRNSQGSSDLVTCIEGENEKINNNNRGNISPCRVSVQKLEAPKDDEGESQFLKDLAEIEKENEQEEVICE